MATTFRDAVKVRLRISAANTAFDVDIDGLIAEADADIKRAGVLVTVIVDTDPSIARAIILYCRANFDLSNPDYDKLVRSYESQRDSLALDGDYNGLVV